MKELIKIAILVLFANWVHGKDLNITVRVIDEITKKPIRNANVIVTGTTSGTFTNVAGFFKLTISTKLKRFTVSHVSYRTETFEAPKDVNSFTIKLKRMIFQFPIDMRDYPKHFDSLELLNKGVILKGPTPDSLHVVESLADFDGGIKTFLDFLGNNFVYPLDELKKNTGGLIRLEFTIDKYGDYKSLRCLPDSVGEICGELKRILTVIPKWRPAEQRGEPIDQEMAIIVFYGLNDYWKKKLKKSVKD
jgi:hypothetical protein